VGHPLLARKRVMRGRWAAGGYPSIEFGLTLLSSYDMVQLFIENISTDNKCLPSKIFLALIVFTSTVLIVMNQDTFMFNEKT
jgi:hypothetical protein